MKKTIYDIANELGLATSTVSKALNNYRGVSEKTKQRVLDYTRKVKYYPNANASKLKLSRSYTIGIIFSEALNIGLEHNFFSSIIQSFKSYVESNGYEIVFVINNLGNKNMSYVDFCQQKDVEGVIIITSIPSDPHVLELVKSDIPCVTTDLHLEKSTTVISDNKDGIKQAVDFFIESGSKKIGHVAGPLVTLSARERLDAFKEIMSEIDSSYNDENIYYTDHYSFEYGYSAGNEYLLSKDRPDSIICASDEIAFGFIRCMQEHDVKVPEDVQVIGFDDIPFSKYYLPSLSTIKQDTKILGSTAAKHLLDLIESKSSKEENTVIVPVELVIRNSTK